MVAVWTVITRRIVEGGDSRFDDGGDNCESWAEHTKDMNLGSHIRRVRRRNYGGAASVSLLMPLLSVTEIMRGDFNFEQTRIF